MDLQHITQLACYIIILPRWVMLAFVLSIANGLLGLKFKKIKMNTSSKINHN